MNTTHIWMNEITISFNQLINNIGTTEFINMFACTSFMNLLRIIGCLSLRWNESLSANVPIWQERKVSTSLYSILFTTNHYKNNYIMRTICLNNFQFIVKVATLSYSAQSLNISGAKKPMSVNTEYG